MTIFHGGRLDEAVARHGGRAKEWLDLSTAINPKAWPLDEVSIQNWQGLPQQSEMNSLVTAARKTYGTATDAPCSLAGGSQAHIQALPYLFKPQPVAILGFTYQEHGLCWQRAGHDVLVADGLGSAEVSARIVIVVNPNNPDGRTVLPDELAGLALRLASKGGLLLVDEAFADLMPEISAAGHAGQPGLVVLRSFGKFYGLAGLRLGFAFGPELLMERLRDFHGPWPISGPAISVGSAALADTKWARRARTRLATGRTELEGLLQGMGLNIVGATDLFVLASHDRAAAIHDHLIRNQVLTRPFPGRQDWLRFGIPGTKHGMNRLKKVLSEFIW